ncbi:MAG: TonB C-terminal domain-containing protein [Myxococcales bacterium]|nr:TonB C-terminal domain-containing protein [Myxococcales bacterium]
MEQGASHSLLRPRRQPFWGFMLGSLVGHGALLAVGLLAAAFWGTRVIDLDQKPIRATLVRKGKPRDSKLLPRKETPPPPPKRAEEVPVPIPGVKPPEKSKSKVGEKSGEERRNKLFGAFDKLSKAKPEEPEGQEDGDPDGDSSTQEGERYFGLISAQVRRHYDVSSSVPEQERIRLSAQLLILIGRAGELIEVKFARGSGNDLFDNAVLGAVKRASPFPPPPAHLREQLKSDGVILVFRP